MPSTVLFREGFTSYQFVSGTYYDWTYQSAERGNAKNTIRVVSPNGAAALADREAVERILHRARLRYMDESASANEGVDRVFIEVDYWQSEIYGGLAKWSVENIHDTGIDCQVVWEIDFEHQPYWEHVQQSSSTTYANLNNNSLSQFTFSPQPSDKAGIEYDLIFRLRNNEPSSPFVKDVVLAMNKGSTVWNDILWFEGESSTTSGAGVTAVNTAVGDASTGFVKTLSWSGTSIMDLLRWPVNPNVSARTRGKPVTPIVRLIGPKPSNLQIRMVVRQDLTAVAIGEWTQVRPGELQILAPIAVPNAFIVNTQVHGLDLDIQARAPSGGATSISLDYVSLTGRDGIMLLSSLSAGLPQNSELVIDPYTQTVYEFDNLTNQHRTGWSLYGTEKFSISPNEPVVFTLLTQSPAGTANAGRLMKPSVFYKPRRRSPV